MARDYGPFPSEPMYEVVNRRMQRALAEAVLSTGFAKTGQGAVTAGTGAELVIAAYPDGALVDGLYVENSASETVTVTTNSGSTNPRIDRLVMRLDMAAETIAPFQIVGTPAASPQAPPLVKTAAVYDMPLCQYRFPGSASAQNPGSIVDERQSLTSAPFGLLYGTTTQNVPSGGTAFATLNLADPQKQVNMSAAPATGRLIATVAGWYAVSGMAMFDGGPANGRRIAGIMKNGVMIEQSQGTLHPNTVNTVPVPTASIPVELAVGDYVTLAAFQDSGATREVDRVLSFIKATYIGPS